ncbi:rhomboid family intramembrane serine protease [Aliiglaciecola sp. LCG003]|uniref:rhomboid family intramembrane serine protease n=1 Tax=Aliiglaciecola sp. LCG003 TaxID=3053655 RepID=UPI002573B3CD|nr:rhomboid family intramembrane serine protease [Aliiglaciecola sp. LCG003]WJG08446.1 rhomboid family intramembrane serine protease [Aliiglaciecola sp. LCG003]
MTGNATSKLYLQFKFVFYFILTFAIIELVNIISNRSLNVFGIYPRELFGLRGILLSPLLHRDIFHFGANIVTLAIFSWLVLQYGRNKFFAITLFIVLSSGLMVWILGRSAMHIGASGLVYGYLGFLFLGGLLAERFKLLFISLIVTFFYGGLIFGVFPTRTFVSWESHLFGFITGLVAAKIWAKRR